ncbi:unnamed protein product [Ostreobium quekettii]|uniref:Uncharacterized protein n=1 Tax=Ostreobium quekettii TaxID=121088 RepID=A0A8S1J7T0_9CHLO|nr:unnamed protein product [Ostreobium quekettii]
MIAVTWHHDSEFGVVAVRQWRCRTEIARGVSVVVWSGTQLVGFVKIETVERAAAVVVFCQVSSICWPSCRAISNMPCPCDGAQCVDTNGSQNGAKPCMSRLGLNQ